MVIALLILSKLLFFSLLRKYFASFDARFAPKRGIWGGLKRPYDEKLHFLFGDSDFCRIFAVPFHENVFDILRNFCASRVKNPFFRGAAKNSAKNRRILRK